MSNIDKKVIHYQRSFGKRLKELRLARSMSQLDLATLCEVEKTTISRIENGRTNVTLKTMVILSEALGVTPDQFLV